MHQDHVTKRGIRLGKDMGLTFQVLALRQVVVHVGRQERVPVPSDDPFEEPVLCLRCRREDREQFSKNTMSQPDWLATYVEE